MENPPIIDGKISESEWQNAVKWDNFLQISPGDNSQPSEKTEVYLAYDFQNIYCLAKCYYENPQRIRNFHCSRDKIYTTDRIFFFFDTFLSNDKAYYIGCNANGEQADGIVLSDIDPSIDLYYLSHGSITDF